MAPGLRRLPPASVLAAKHPHGTRTRYLGGCKCVLCRAASAMYQRERRVAIATGGWNGYVSAAPVRAKLKRLSKQGLGIRQVSAIANVSAPVLVEIKAGRQVNIRAQAAKRIRAIKRPGKLLADHTLVPAAGTWRLIERLRAEGFTKRQLSALIGGNARNLQIGKERTRVITRARVQRLYKRLMN